MVTTVKKATIHTHETTGLKYISGAKSVLFKNGTLMSYDDFARYKEGGLAERMQVLLNAPNHVVYDWAYACSTGRLRRKRLYVKPIDPMESIDQPAASLPVQKEAPKFTAKFSSALLIMCVMAIVGVGSAIMSAYHTSAFLIYGGKPVWTAVMTGIMLILFSATAFTAARYFFNEGGALHMFGILFVIAGFVVIGYSMFATLTVNYDQFQWRDNAKAVEVVAESEALSTHRELIRQNEQALADTIAEITKLEEDAAYWRTMSWRRYDDIQVLTNTAREKRDALREQEIVLKRGVPDLIEIEAVSQDSVYLFIGRLFNAEQDVMRFLVYVVPACLYDILAPFALSIVLLLMDRKKQEAV